MESAQDEGSTITHEVALGAYPAKRCPRVTHNEHSATSPPLTVPDSTSSRLVAEGLSFETESALPSLLERASAAGLRVVVIADDLTWKQASRETMTAADERADVIVNARLPRVGRRNGAPDVLVAVEGGYLPVDVKGHRTWMTHKTGTILVSSFASPGDVVELSGAAHSDHWKPDARQLAHYTRMMQDLGMHPQPRETADPEPAHPEPVTEAGHPGSTPATKPRGGDGESDPTRLLGGIIGTSAFDDVSGDPLGIVWHDLSVPREKTYSTSRETFRDTRSAMQRYDHEFAFRLKVADAARAGEEIVRPLRIAECDGCVWLEHCREVVGPEDASFAIPAAPLDAREWIFLYDRGGSTVTGLAGLEASELEDEYIAHAVNKRQVAVRLRETITRARMVAAGEPLLPLSGTWPPVPAADLEIDFDIEWDRDNRIYQWGLLVRDGQDVTKQIYDPAVSFAPLDDAGEQALADEFAVKLTGYVQAAEAAGKSVAIYHWSAVERTRSRAFPAVDALLQGRAVDLLAWFRSRFLTVSGGSIKNVAPLFGFSWRVEDAGGFYSQEQIETARTEGHGSPAARWVLDYNRSDVEAQAAIRDGLREVAARGGFAS